MSSAFGLGAPAPRGNRFHAKAVRSFAAALIAFSTGASALQGWGGEPGPPTLVSATAGDGQVTVSFTAPTSIGDGPITGYTATCNPGAVTATGADSPITITGLTNGTAYTCAVTATNVYGTGSASGTLAVTPATTSYSAMSGTGSGIVSASFTGGGANCTFVVHRFIRVTGDPASPPASGAPGSVTFPDGLFDFTTGSCTPGSTITMTVTWPTVLQPGTKYYKYGPTSATPSPHWYVLPATVSGNTTTFTITDGGLGDDDLTANGAIVDQGGPGAPAAPVAPMPVPTLSQWALILLSLLLLAAGARSMGRSR